MKADERSYASSGQALFKLSGLSFEVLDMDDLSAQGGDLFLEAGDLSLEVCQLS